MRFYEDPLSIEDHLAWGLRQARWAVQHGLATATGLRLAGFTALDALGEEVRTILQPLQEKLPQRLDAPPEVSVGPERMAYEGDRDAAIIAARSALDDAVEFLQSAYQRAKGTPWQEDFMWARIKVFQILKPLRDALKILEVEALGSIRSMMKSMLDPPDPTPT